MKDSNFWKNKKVFVTGHTGFKGSWLIVYLKLLGAKVYGYSVGEKKISIFNKAKLSKYIDKSYFGDIRDRSKLNKILKSVNPDVIFHLAAQSLVSYSIKNPHETYDVNFNGTNILLQACKNLKKLKLLIITTTDKVYKPLKKKYFFIENDLLAGTDPYSWSKVFVENLIKGEIDNQVLKFKVATVRSGNVIGLGDLNFGRIVPDILQSIKNKKILKVRNPKYVRPWLYVLDTLRGYIKLAEKLCKEKKSVRNNINWNFSPNKSDHIDVNTLIKNFKKYYFFKTSYLTKKNFKETMFLRLNSDKVRKKIKWTPLFNIKKIVEEICKYNNFKYDIKLMRTMIINFLNCK